MCWNVNLENKAQRTSAATSSNIFIHSAKSCSCDHAPQQPRPVATPQRSFECIQRAT